MSHTLQEFVSKVEQFQMEVQQLLAEITKISSTMDATRTAQVHKQLQQMVNYYHYIILKVKLVQRKNHL